MWRVWLLVGFGTLIASTQALAVTIDWVTVGDPGNAADTEVMNDGSTGHGSVAYAYRISKYETTNAQYAEFLNAVAATDTYALYNTNMNLSFGGISRSGSPGSYSYSAVAGRENNPVNFVSWYDSIRFANWMHNGQGSGDTETGAYTITLAGLASNSITRNPNATIFLTSEDEWYKAAYFDGSSYFNYPVGTDTGSRCTATVGVFGPNAANCNNVFGFPTDVGTFAGSASPYGTYDQGGNVGELNESLFVISGFGAFVSTRGGSFDHLPERLAANHRVSEENRPSFENDSVGFRVASVIPEPSTGLLLATGLLGLAATKRSRRPSSGGY